LPNRRTRTTAPTPEPNCRSARQPPDVNRQSESAELRDQGSGTSDVRVHSLVTCSPER